jgi:membrane-associated protein
MNQLVGWVGIIANVLAETGLLVGFFLPGDSLLFSAGVLVAAGKLDVPIWLLMLSLIAAAIIGDTVGYWFGAKVGNRLYARPDSRLFKRKHLLRTQAFYEKHGGKTIVLARFIPIVRTFAPVVAGVAKMPYSQFVFFNVAGGVLWVVLCCMAGYILGNAIGNIDRYILPIAAFIIVISVLPPALHVWKENRAGGHPEPVQK